MSPKQAIMKLRMECASYLLVSTVLPIGEIAQQIGFANQYHFSKTFKNFFELTPTRYRKMPSSW
jgi:transcriptional regulator GlxA family with amidase domain